MTIRMTGKYFKAISDYVAAISFEENWRISLASPQFDALGDAVCKIHGKHLSERDARIALLHAIFDCMQGRGGADQLPVAPELQDEIRTKLTDALRDLIESLPWAMCVKFPLPGLASLAQFEIRISDSILLRNGLVDDPAPDTDGFNSLLKAALTHGQHAQLRVSVQGFSDSDPGGTAVSQAISLAKQCLYFMEAFTFQIHPFSDLPQSPAYVVLPNEKRLDLRLPETLMRHFNGMRPREVTQVDDRAGLAMKLVPGGGSVIHDPLERVRWLQRQLEPAVMFFSHRNHPDFDALGAAMEWYVDSITADNQTFAYIAACIGLEAILGYGDSPEKMDSMSPRLADRYGFLLGLGRAERESLAGEYRKMLTLRGRLVHARSARLTANERVQLHKVQDMLSKVISKEVQTMILAIPQREP